LKEERLQMPRIATQTLAEHRDWRRNQLIEAATAIALESGVDAVTVAAVAQRAGLARTSVYDYFASSAELVTDLIIEELGIFTQELTLAIKDETDPRSAVKSWIEVSLGYVADGRHILAKALSATSFSHEQEMTIGLAHRRLFAPLSAQLELLGIKDTAQALALLHAATDAATKRIENGHDAEHEINATSAFCIAGLTPLISL
jgi:AcrR family transcriptional regulator